MSHETQVHSVPDFDLGKYLGLWYEIGRLPLKWQDTTSSHVTAYYTLNDDGSVQVDNRCFDEDSEPTQALGRALPVEGESGQLTVSFLPKLLRWIPFTEGDYWVLKIDPDYNVALVGTPDHANLWLLARDWKVSDETFRAYMAEATAQGFDLAEWITPLQDGKRVDDSLLN